MIVVYAGPTISHEHIRQHLDCVCLPPVKHGDIIDILQQSPEAIGIIDGYFEGVPSVWHKEILHAMDLGVAVYGSASMGALRATELCDFGMVGVGQIFEWFRDGLLEDDDEVAVLHGPEEAGFLAASLPMVNIRATLALAQRHQIIDKSQKESLLAIAKCRYYKKRSWNRLLEDSEELFEQHVTNSLRVWLSTNKVDQKRTDAIEMLTVMKDSRARDMAISEKNFYFNWTNVWDVAVRERHQISEKMQGISKNGQKVLDQLYMAPDLYRRYADKALLSWICKNHIESHIDDLTLKAALNRFREDNELNSRAQLIDYMERADLDEATLTALLTDAAGVELAAQAAGALHTGIIEQLKIDGQYVRLLAKALNSRF